MSAANARLGQHACRDVLRCCIGGPFVSALVERQDPAADIGQGASDREPEGEAHRASHVDAAGGVCLKVPGRAAYRWAYLGVPVRRIAELNAGEGIGAVVE